MVGIETGGERAAGRDVRGCRPNHPPSFSWMSVVSEPLSYRRGANDAIARPRGRLLRPGSSVQAFLGGHFPRTWKKLSSWVVRRTFIRAVRLFVALRCKAPGYVPLSKEAYRKERDRLIRIGRAAVHAARQATFGTTNRESCDSFVDDEELRTLRACTSSAVEEEYKRSVKSKLSDGGGGGGGGDGGSVKGDGDGGKGGDGGGGALAATVARLEGDVQSLRSDVQSLRGDVQSLRGELASTQSELQAGIDGLGGQVRDMTALLRTALGERDRRVRLE